MIGWRIWRAKGKRRSLLHRAPSQKGFEENCACGFRGFFYLGLFRNHGKMCDEDRLPFKKQPIKKSEAPKLFDSEEFL